MDIEQNQAELIDNFVKQASAQKGTALGSVILEATSHPSLFAFSEILALPTVAELEGTENSVYLKVLQLFAHGTWSDYKSNCSSLPQLVPDQVLKLKQLTVLTLAETNKVLPYDELMMELDVTNVRELEDFLINECIYLNFPLVVVPNTLDQTPLSQGSRKEGEKGEGAPSSPYCYLKFPFGCCIHFLLSQGFGEVGERKGPALPGIVRGKLDQLRRCFEIQFAAGRDLRPGQLGSMIQTLSNWLGTSDNLLVSIQEEIKWADTMSELDKKHRKEVEDRVEEVKKSVSVKAEVEFRGLEDIYSEPGGVMDYEEDRSRPKRRRHPRS
ncbi:hypothetical protein GOBAR_DD35278 [Gossypium barbadense]|nr:hypothetical protein GOBAR_DD35278 [Gossypium barbadense]